MDGNKDEALRCVRNAEEAIGLGNKERAMKFIKIAQRLNCNLEVDELLAACEKLGTGGSGSSVDGKSVVEETEEPDGVRGFEGSNEGQSYTEEHVNLIKQINRTRDYYSILGVEKSCSIEEIRKAYRKLSLKVHPDKNKVPGSEEVFKKVCQAFKCLSDNDSRRKYDLTGGVDDYEYNQQHTVRRRRRRTASDVFNDDFDPDEIFRSFFGQPDMFRTARVYRTRETTSNYQREEINGGGPNLIVLLQILPFLLIVLLAYLPFSEPDYSLHKNVSYQFPRTTEKYGVDFYVKSSSFDQNYPLGSTARDNIEENVISDYKNMLWRYCRIELQRRHWSKNLPIPHCDKLQNLGLA